MNLTKFIYYVRFRLEEEITRVCPVDKGFLRANLKVLIKENELIVEMPEYGLLVEYGTSQMIAAHGEHDPNNPVTDWAALRKRGGSGQTMPFIRNTMYHKLPGILNEGSRRFLDNASVEVTYS